MKKVILTVIALATLTAVSAKEKKTKNVRCVKTYESIKVLLDNKTITLKEAQRLWTKHRKKNE